MVVELHNGKVLRTAPRVIFVLLLAFPWMLAIPLWLKVSSTIALSMTVLLRIRRHDKEQVRKLYLEPDNTLSVAVSSPVSSPGDAPENYRMFKVRSVQVLRFFRHYIEMILDPGNGQTTHVTILPGMCTPDAIRQLRKFLLRTRQKKP